MEDHFHIKHRIYERIPIEQQGLTLVDTDPVAYRLTLNSEARKNYQSMMKDNIKVMDVYDTVQRMFGSYQEMQFKNNKVRCDLYANRVVFLSKLDQMNSEFDSTIGAGCANLMY